MTEPCELDEFRENVEDFVNNLREVLDKLSRLMRSGSKLNPLLIEECLQEVHRMAFILAGEQDEVVEAVIAEMRGQLEQTIPPAVVESLFANANARRLSSAVGMSASGDTSGRLQWRF